MITPESFPLWIKRCMYAFFPLLLLICTFVYLERYQHAKHTLANGKTVEVIISDTWCSSSSKTRTCIWFSYNKQVHSVHVNYSDCLKYKRGDHLLLLYDSEDDLFLSVDELLEYKDPKTFIICAIAFIILLILTIRAGGYRALSLRKSAGKQKAP